MDNVTQILSCLLWFLGVLIVYHHIGFPLIVKWRRAKVCVREQETVKSRLKELPNLTVFMPAYNEAKHIAHKLRNLAAIDYPETLLRVVVVCDGCTDETVSIARSVAKEPELGGLKIEIIDEPVNRGKIAVLNRYIPTIPSGVIALTDVTAELPTNAFRKAAESFVDKDVGVVAASYQLSNIDNAGEATYWRYQVANKEGEAAFGSPLGVHGALYFIRAAAFQKLEPDTINDDFIIPMRAVSNGWRALYKPEIVAVEREVANHQVDFSRRRRISAGNVQQLIRMPELLSPRLGGVAFAFASGKALRAIMPFMLIAFLLGSSVLSSISELWKVVFVLEFLGIGLVVLRHFLLPPGRSKILDIVHYVVMGHTAGFIGGLTYLFNPKQIQWSSNILKKESTVMSNMSIETKSIALAKRSFDMAFAFVGLILSLPIMLLVCIAIKLDSRGPVLFQQTRVGRAWPNYTELFTMYKFRSMQVDAEKISGPVWATKNDPRITTVGKFLRKTRLDEIPQLVNVLKGDMSLVGPRPERPGICDKLENAIPFYADRTYGVRPGITGLAQVFQGYDETIEDVRSKVSYDHAYAMATGTWKSWLKLDLEILVRTVAVVAFGRGQ
jgi:lipopolysaccharide/colanic/teichoic acid biosynthesis glycosyltransferase/cellulose synthase/poly-beta-1,6-N-acetylglucosamine synthase-like glycosyltransferase